MSLNRDLTKKSFSQDTSNLSSVSTDAIGEWIEIVIHDDGFGDVIYRGARRERRTGKPVLKFKLTVFQGKDGKDFSQSDLIRIGNIVTRHLIEKYGYVLSIIGRRFDNDGYAILEMRLEKYV